VGEGGGGFPDGKVRVYLNQGSLGQPQFDDYFYAQSDGMDLICPASGCMGCFPRVVFWDDDGLKDLLVGQAGGTLIIFLNVNTNDDPQFDGGTLLEVGPEGSKIAIDVGSRATPHVVDWNNDGMKDLVVGALDGLVRIYINQGSHGNPDFQGVEFAQSEGSNLVVPTQRSSPFVLDLDGDGNKDILSGNTEGELLFYTNIASDESPIFCCGAYVESDGVAINLPGSARSRPFVCHWTGDGVYDVLIGGSDGFVHLYQGTHSSSSAGDGEDLLTRFRHLLPVFPNPSIQEATIPMALAQRGHVRVTVHDVAGRLVALLSDRVLDTGVHRVRWNGRDDAGRGASTGVYLVRAEGQGWTESSRLLFIARGSR
jgi:hypothetical protein